MFEIKLILELAESLLTNFPSRRSKDPIRGKICLILLFLLSFELCLSHSKYLCRMNAMMGI